MSRHRNKKQNSFNCYIRNQTDDSADIYFYGDIVGNDGDKWWGNDDKCPSDVATLLKECENVSQLNIYVNSNGGDVFAGNAIYNMLKRHKAHKTVYVDGLAASIASVIVMAGDEIIMPANSYLMIHKAWTYAMGNANDLRTDWKTSNKRLLIHTWKMSLKISPKMTSNRKCLMKRGCQQKMRRNYSHEYRKMKT